MSISEIGSAPSFANEDQTRLEMFKHLGFNPVCIYDVGASNGAWTRAISKIFPDAHFHLFEPLAEIAPDYRQGLHQLLQDKMIRCNTHSFALGQTKGEVEIGVNPTLVGSSILAERRNEYFPDSATIQVISMDEAIETLNLQPPQLLKMDTQGFELEILKGSINTLKHHIEMILLEAWLVRGYGVKTPLMTEVMEWLAHHQFFPVDLAGYYRDPSGILVSQDVFFVKHPSPLTNDRFDRVFIPGDQKAEKALSQEDNQTPVQLQQTEQSQTEQSILLKNLESALAETTAKLENTQQVLQESQQREQKLRNRVQNLKNRVDRLKLRVAEAQSEISAMESSKFWRLRTQWLKLRELMKQ
jgi:FkbM family methyltransferase